MKIISIPELASAEELDAHGSHISVDTLNWTSYPYKPDVKCLLGHTDLSMLVKFKVTEGHAAATCMENNGEVWKDSCVEFFVREPGNPFYYNFETNCIGTILAAKRTGRDDAVHFTEKELASISHIPSLDKHPFADKSEAWSLSLEIPFKLIGIGSGIPKTLDANFYKCGDDTAIPHYLSWNPILTPEPDFHRPEFFGKLIML
ncbi:MAG: carbohydrate-binding family 9-like protein [Bacteroidales bacterium]|jgi:hypothetical protein|nr:carbohydrate-binding family 9-like protein [Bacteroidales bacterium]MCI2121685.1 carbohydrate-binding family 9-like protein [Bacteroidales bacterium]MCI2144890.1 carbohydrate-binding family 9-like protein [Bacteroidales bacterium]